MFEDLLKFFVVMFVVVDPPALAPIFAGLTEGASRQYQRRMALKSCVISLLIFVGFAAGGAAFLSIMGISTDAFRISGGIMLFIIALDMVFAREEKTTAAENDETRRHADISVFPLAFPLISGPGAIATVLLLFGSVGSATFFAGHVLVIALVVGCCWVTMLAAPRVMKVLGVTGANVLARLLGVVLAALAVQFILDGIRSALQLG